MRRPDYFDKDEVARETQDWRQETMAHYMANPGRIPVPYELTWWREGLEKITNEAIRLFESETGVRFPFDCSMWAPYHGRSRYRRHFDFAVVEKVFQFTGWLKAAAKFPRIKQLFRYALQQDRGVNSPYTLINPWEVAQKFPSPGSLEKFIILARRRANDILAPYGLRASRDVVCFVINRYRVPKRIGKGARAIAAETIRFFCTNGHDGKYLGAFYGSSRDILMKARGLLDALRISRAATRWAIEKTETGELSCIRDALASGRLTRDMSDGVELWIDSATAVVRHGLKVVLGWDCYGGKQWLVSLGRRTFHCDISWNEKQAANLALRAWKRQRQIGREEHETLKVLQPSDRDILIWREDSYSAGNCELGTRAFADRYGWGNREFVPAHALIPHISNPNVRRTLRVVARGITATC